MKTTLINQQKIVAIQMSQLQKLTDWIAVQLEAMTAPASWSEVSVILTDNEGITHTNLEYFGKNRPTDVISFRYDPIPGEEGYSGDLIINAERAQQAGPDHQGIPYELALYVAHGFDHLSGAEDDTPPRRSAMRATETGWLAEDEPRALVENLIRF